MTAAVTPTRILTTPLEHSLAAKLAVAERYGRDRDREIAALERQRKPPPAAAPTMNPADVAELRDDVERICSRLAPFHGQPLTRRQAASVCERLIATHTEAQAEIRRLRSRIERLTDGSPPPSPLIDPDPVVYTIRESDFAEPVDWLVEQIIDAHAARNPTAAAKKAR